jgi:hypothetical protein
VDVLPPRRAELKAALLDAIAPTCRGATASEAQAATVRALPSLPHCCRCALTDAPPQVDAAVRALEARNPCANAVASRALAGVWELLYTTEADVHAFSRLPGGVASVSQEVDGRLARVTNRIAWRLFGLRLAAGAPANATPPRRVSYRFDALNLSLGDGVTLAAVQLGERGPGGWTDATYLDADTRVSRNSRGDLLVFARSA